MSQYRQGENGMHSAGLALQDLIAKIIKHVYEKMPPQEAPLIEQFVRAFYANASPDDVAERNIIDLYGSMISCWHFMNAKQNGEYKVHVYNPQFEQHGWQSTHTIIEIVSNDMPFLLDSAQMWFNTHGFTIHFMLHTGGLKIGRDTAGKINEIEADPKVNHLSSETKGVCLSFEINKQSDPAVLAEIKAGLESVLSDVSLVVENWQHMQEKMQSCISNVEKYVKNPEHVKFAENLEFLEWINKNHFTYLGYHELKIVEDKGEKNWHVVPDSRLGVLRSKNTEIARYSKELPQSASDMIYSDVPIFLGKTKTRATVHRPANSDFISIKIFDKNNKVTGEHRFVGLYTAAAYNRSPSIIPLLRGKVLNIVERANMPHESHDGKALLNILENLPRDDLFQASEEEIYQTALGILYLQERQRTRLFVRKDVFGRFYSCLVFVPREIFNSQLREKMQNILLKSLNGYESTFSTRFSESVLARIHFIIKVKEYSEVSHHFEEIEAKLIEAGRTWQDYFRDALVEHYGEEQGHQLFLRYGHAFPLAYQQDFVARTAVYDIQHMESLCSEKTLAMSFYRPLEDTEGILRFKLYKPDSSIPLSDVIPMLECMGLRVINERPHKIETSDGVTIWINDFRMIYDKNNDLDADELRENFQETFYNIWHGRGENDGFNKLVLGAGLNWREITMLRAYAKYLWQIGFTFSQAYVESALVDNPTITRKIVDLFLLRFDPEAPQDSKNTRSSNLRREIKSDLELVSNLDEDRILRRYVDVLLATLRTNYFQKKDGRYKEYLSFKVDPSAIPEMPLPRPMFEIFVYSPRVEGVHLRGAKVARGGLRWSDRREDFRTEVLGLMKAQQVKNAVIVPLGAKGGFVPKCLPANGTREEIMQEGIACYKILIRGLLDITDNIKENSIVMPENVVRYDADDPYLVVAADKGTATFSDIANSISAEYDFWLGDGFASGGSMGYDHKKMGITAKGAWESVKRHFREIGIDVQTQPFTVIGIGDLAGDVFGNGMILSRCIKLVAAFNHLHIFIDPDPDPETSFEERVRIFNLPRSSWEDYNQKLMSKGGGIFSRKAKSIDVSPEMKKLFGINKDKIVPNELMRAILKADVDLLWNGGIGTYVKASYEHNSDVGDRANDALRVNGNELNCKVIGEGGNLGFTQLGRIEYALNGGRANTDAIDNSAGVDCSDHEVNIKILLNQVVASGDLTEKQRNSMLIEMTDEVIELVLEDNRGQISALSLAESTAPDNVELHKRLIEYLEKNANLNRSLEFLPSNEELVNRIQNKQGLTRPELAVLLAYSKTLLKEELLASNLPEDSYISQSLYSPVPSLLREKFHDEMKEHRLHREIITMHVTNTVINEMGMGFINRLQDETGAASYEIVRAYTVSREVFKARQFREAIVALDFIVDAAIQNRMLQELNRLVRRGTRWFLRHRRGGIDIEETIAHFTPLVHEVREFNKAAMRGTAKKYVEKFSAELVAAGAPEEMSYRAACMSVMFSALDIVEAATQYNMSIEKVTSAYYAVGSRLELGWFRQQIKQHTVKNHWEALARAAFRDDLDRQQRSLTISLLLMDGEASDIDARLDAWMDKHKILVERWKYMVSDLKASLSPEFIMYSVALRELLDLAQASIVEADARVNSEEVEADQTSE